MTETNVWDDPAAQVGGDFKKFEHAGDKAEGKVIEVRFGTDFAGNKTPEVVLEDATGQTIVTAGQVRLKAELLEKRPAVGDHCSVELTHIENRPGGKTMKHFEVVVTKPGGAPPAASPPPAAPPVATAPAAVDPAAAAAALAALSPEQRAALGL